jgi:hypothetical protein
MGEQENRETVERFAKTLEGGDMDAMVAMFDEYTADEFVQEWPQSGERLRKQGAKEVNQNYPGMPSFQFRDIKGSGDLWILQGTIDYGQGPVHGVSIFEMRDGKVVRQTDYFADPFEAPEWRAQWVERM